MLAEARKRGVVVETEAAVAQVEIADGQATGVVLENGRHIHAAAVVANVHPQLLFTRMVAPEHLDEDFRQRIRRYKSGSGSFRINVALSELPQFSAAPASQPELPLRSGIVIAPSLQYMEQAFFDAKSDAFSRAPIVEMLIPSMVDDTLAPPGAHVASLFCQHFNPQPTHGRSWDELRDDAAAAIFAAVDAVAPNFSASVIASQLLSPLDLERKFGLVNGDIFHGALSLDQLFSARPVLGFADYRTPVHSLYLCGSGTHPGGGVTGAPGHNAAREIIRDFKGLRAKLRSKRR
jgi:phytoene dehydrogenase-like protein